MFARPTFSSLYIIEILVEHLEDEIYFMRLMEGGEESKIYLNQFYLSPNISSSGIQLYILGILSWISASV